MEKSKSFLAVLLVLVLLSGQLSAQSFSEKTDEQLIQMLEQELNKQEQLVNQQAKHLQTLQEQMNNLQNQLEQADKSLMNSKKGTLKDKIIIGSMCLLSGFAIGSTIVYINK